MTKETVRVSEVELLAFISSTQDEEMARARELAIKAVDNHPGVRGWAFEDAPASSEAARARYIRNAGKADFVIWLIGSTTTQPVVEEVDACLRARRRLLPFKLPVQQRDSQTQELIERVRRIVTWRTVEDLEMLPAHIRAALTDEMVRAVRDPVPIDHDLYLEQKQRESIAETKRLWTVFGVRDDTAQELAEDRLIGHRLDLPTSGVLQVMAPQGSGKTLAAHRLFQHAISNRLENHVEPIPLFLNARHISGELTNYIDEVLGDQGSVYSQRVLVIIDGLDEVGAYKANQILSSAASYTDANQKVAAVAMIRYLPGLKSVGKSTALPECSEEEFLLVASRVAGRTVNANQIPYRLRKTRLPLFAVIVGTHFISSRNPLSPSPSQMVSQLVQRIMEESDDYPEEMAGPLKKLAVGCINSGESVSRALIDPKASVHAHIAGSRLVVEEDGKFDFALAIFREWFAARALVEETVSPSDIELTSDRWVVPLAIAINSENASLGREIMKTITTKDPGIAGLVLDEVRHSWSTEEPSENLPRGDAIDLGHRIRQAMIDWNEGLGSLMSDIGPTSQSGAVPSLAVDKGPRMVTTSWYRGEQELEPVVEMTGDMRPFTGSARGDWARWRSTVIEDTRTWSWSITHEDLSQSLSDQLETYRFALDSVVGLDESAAEFAANVSSYFSSTSSSPKVGDLVDLIDDWICRPGHMTSLVLRSHRYTVEELKLVRTKLSGLPRDGRQTVLEPWPAPDKPWPEGRTSVTWYELYTDEQLLQRTEAIFQGALRIYNDIVERRFPVFNKRHQMSYMLPLKLEGILSPRSTNDRLGWSDPILFWWPRLVNSNAESGVSFELGSEDAALGPEARQMLEVAEDEFLLNRGSFFRTSQAVPGNDPRPATKMAHDWLAADLRDLRWL